MSGNCGGRISEGYKLSGFHERPRGRYRVATRRRNIQQYKYTQSMIAIFCEFFSCFFALLNERLYSNFWEMNSLEH